MNVPGPEVQLKAFVVEVAAREHITETAVYLRVQRGAYPGLVVRRKNARVVFVRGPAGAWVDRRRKA